MRAVIASARWRGAVRPELARREASTVAVSGERGDGLLFLTALRQQPLLCMPRREKRRRKRSAAVRKRMAEAQKARWAKIKGESVSVSTEPPKARRQISEEGMKRIIAATKRRWRLQKAQAASSAPAKKASVKAPAAKRAVRATAAKKIARKTTAKSVATPPQALAKSASQLNCRAGSVSGRPNHKLPSLRNRQ
jgi:hypothetical protein